MATDALTDTALTPDRWPLGRPLPVEVAGSGQGWFTRYRRWPVFSPTWQRGRLLAVGLPLLLLLAVPMTTSWPADPMEQPWGAVAQLAINLGWQVHRGTVVRADRIARAQRDELGRITLNLRGHAERLAVSQAYAWRFKPM